MLQEDAVQEILARLAWGERIKVIARELGVDRKTIKRWRRLGRGICIRDNHGLAAWIRILNGWPSVGRKWMECDDPASRTAGAGLHRQCAAGATSDPSVAG